MRLTLLIVLSAVLSGCSYLHADDGNKPYEPAGPIVATFGISENGEIRPVAGSDVEVIDCDRSRCDPLIDKPTRVIPLSLIAHQGSCYLTFFSGGSKYRIRLPDSHPYCQ